MSKRRVQVSGLPIPLQETDLRPLSRHPDRAEATVYLYVRDPKTYVISHKVWLRLGEVCLRRFDNPYEYWTLSAYFDNVTDYEHDSAKILVLPLIGLAWDSLFVYHHQTRIIGWIDPESTDFHVPRPGYDPRKEEGLMKCTECNPKHPMVSKYVPPYDGELYKAVAGSRVLVVIGPTFVK